MCTCFFIVHILINIYILTFRTIHLIRYRVTYVEIKQTWPEGVGINQPRQLPGHRVILGYVHSSVVCQ